MLSTAIKVHDLEYVDKSGASHIHEMHIEIMQRSPNWADRRHCSYCRGGQAHTADGYARGREGLLSCIPPTGGADSPQASTSVY